ncbi:unnamed protein product [Rhizophagus irregularis]|uniref:Uncharacterized protein n=1 Tax=Rhizophagus irregularis TaxID=588596 RepID=A0A915ZYY9_9GLOM|nr:unnamed protein product [Rhizophagus irregularis]
MRLLLLTSVKTSITLSFRWKSLILSNDDLTALSTIFITSSYGSKSFLFIVWYITVAEHIASRGPSSKSFSTLAVTKHDIIKTIREKRIDIQYEYSKQLKVTEAPFTALLNDMLGRA